MTALTLQIPPTSKKNYHYFEIFDMKKIYCIQTPPTSHKENSLLHLIMKVKEELLDSLKVI